MSVQTEWYNTGRALSTRAGTQPSKIASFVLWRQISIPCENMKGVIMGQSLEPRPDTQMGGASSIPCDVPVAQGCGEGGSPERTVQMPRDEERLYQREEQKLGRETALFWNFPCHFTGKERYWSPSCWLFGGPWAGWPGKWGLESSQKQKRTHHVIPLFCLLCSVTPPRTDS